MIENGVVYTESTVRSGAVVRVPIDHLYRTELSYLSGVVTAEYRDYENNLIDYNEDITFECEGETYTTQAINGVATMEIVVDTGLSVVVRTTNVGIRNGEVTVND